MRIKAADVMYCGVNQDRIITAEPTLDERNTRTFMQFVKRRYGIHVRKDVQQRPAPWTKDEILLKYRFTNVRREHDWQTRQLIERVSLNPDLSLEDKIVNTFMFRAWNNADTFEFFGLPRAATKLYSPKMKELARLKYRGYADNHPEAFAERKWWSGAYNQGGTKYAWKFPDGDGFSRAPSEAAGARFEDYEPDIPLRVFHIPVWLRRANIAERLLEADTQQAAYEVIRSIRGFADFLAYQVFVDLTYIPDFPFSENEFVIAGPGCKRGIDLIFADRDGMDYSEAMFWLRDNWTEVCEQLGVSWDNLAIFSDLPKYDRRMNVMSIENCFCEISKYIKARDGVGKPRQTYKPRKE